MKLLITGGHLTPALAFLQFLKQKQINALFIGRNTHNASHAPSREASEVNRLGFDFVSLNQIKFDRHHKMKSIIKTPLIFPEIAKAHGMIKAYKPDVIVSFGGYLAIPVALAAKIAHIPLITHEQTTKAGLANQLIGRVATKIALSYSSSKPYFNAKKAVMTGNLIRSEFYAPQPVPKWIQSPQKPILFILGGSQGSKLLNQIIASSKKLSQEFTLVHQIGSDQTATKKPQVFTKSWFTASETAWLMAHAALIISRAGANTVSEVVTSGTPAILIPLLGAQKNEQYYNALLISERGAGLIINQTELDSDSLNQAIKKVLSDPHYKKSAQANASRHKSSNSSKFYHQVVSLKK